MLYLCPDLDLADAIQPLRFRHLTSGRNATRLRGLHDAGILQEVLAKEDLPVALKFIKDVENEDKETEVARQTAEKHARLEWNKVRLQMMGA